MTFWRAFIVFFKGQEVYVRIAFSLLVSGHSLHSPEATHVAHIYGLWFIYVQVVVSCEWCVNNFYENCKFKHQLPPLWCFQLISVEVLHRHRRGSPCSGSFLQLRRGCFSDKQAVNMSALMDCFMVKGKRLTSFFQVDIKIRADWLVAEWSDTHTHSSCVSLHWREKDYARENEMSSLH